MNWEKGFFHQEGILSVLSVLVDGDKYGYQIVRELEARCDHTFYFKEGELYPVLHRLEREKIIFSYDREFVSGEIRRYYRLTQKGLLLFHEKAKNWKLFAKKVNAIVGGEKDAFTR